MQHVLRTHTFIWAVFKQLTAASIAAENNNNNAGYMHETKTYLLLIVQNTSLQNMGAGIQDCKG